MFSQGENKVADLYCEGVDQFSGWFQSSLLLSIGLNKQAPYKNILVHGFVVDETNRKMSKSIGNVIEPRQAIHGIPGKLPACGLDVLRFWIAHEYYKPHIQIGKAILEKFHKRTFEIRSILRFITGNLNDLDVNKLDQQLVPYEAILPIDKYLLHQLNSLIDLVVTNYDEMQLNKTICLIENFFLTQVSSFYIKSVRDRLYCESLESLERRSCQTTLYYLLTKSLLMIAPILPHLAEEAFYFSILQKKPNKMNDYSLFRSDFKLETNPVWYNKSIEELFLVVDQFRTCFFDQIQSEKMTIFEVNIKCNQQLYDLLETYSKTSNDWLLECLGCSKLNIAKINEETNCQDLKIVKLNEIDYGFELRVKKLTDQFFCSRCRRYTSHRENEICFRCVNVLKSKL